MDKQVFHFTSYKTYLQHHYSTIVSLSRQDVERIKERILEEIKANQAIIKDSKEEELYAYTVDFFSMKR